MNKLIINTDRHPEEIYLTLDKESLVNVISLLVAQLADTNLNRHHSGACPTVFVDFHDQQNRIIEKRRMSFCLAINNNNSNSKNLQNLQDSHDSHYSQHAHDIGNCEPY
jgi:hypothetical protein